MTETFASFLADVTIGHAIGVVVGVVAGVWLVKEVKRAPLGYQTADGYGPVDLATKLAEAEAHGRVRGRLETLRAIHDSRPAGVRARNGAVEEDAGVVELAEWAEARGRGDVA